jgi:Raf kinase inhibitor-like YbhB/YbcL family protein
VHAIAVEIVWARRTASIALLACVALAACTGSQGANAPAASNPLGSAAPAALSPPTSSSEVTAMPSTGPFSLTSSAFADGAAIPAEYSCQGADVSPELSWTGAPAGAGALVLVVDDPDARDFTHWLVLDIDPTTGGLPKDVSPSAAQPQQGRNGFGRVGWGGPCPPSGTHRYRFTLYAMAAPLGLAGHPDRSAVEAALARGEVLGNVVLTGTYRKG